MSAPRPDPSHAGAAGALLLLAVRLAGSPFSSASVALQALGVLLLVVGTWRGRSWNGLLDAAVAGVLVADAVATWTSSYRPNSFPALADTAAGVALYAWRSTVDTRRARPVAVALSLAGAFLAASHLLRYFGWSQSFRALGFTDLSPFRNLFWSPWLPPAPPGEQLTSFLALLAFPLLLTAGRSLRSSPAAVVPWLTAQVAIVLVVASGFARGLYLGLAAAAFVLVAGSVLYRQPWRAGASAVLRVALPVGLLVLVTPLRGGVAATLSDAGGEARGRSISGRVQVWRTALRSAAEHPLTGVGPGNFGRRYADIGDGSGGAAAVRAYNTLLQLLVEYGALGLAAHVFFLAAVIVTAHRRLRDAPERAMVLAAAAMIVALLARDLTYSSLLGNPFVGSVMWYLAGTVRSER